MLTALENNCMAINSPFLLIFILVHSNTARRLFCIYYFIR